MHKKSASRDRLRLLVCQPTRRPSPKVRHFADDFAEAFAQHPDIGDMLASDAGIG